MKLLQLSKAAKLHIIRRSYNNIGKYNEPYICVVLGEAIYDYIERHSPKDIESLRKFSNCYGFSGVTNRLLPELDRIPHSIQKGTTAWESCTLDGEKLYFDYEKEDYISNKKKVLKYLFKVIKHDNR